LAGLSFGPQPTNVAEGLISTPVNSGGPVLLVANPADVPNSAVAGATVLNPPDTGLGLAFFFPPELLANQLFPAGSTLGLSGSVPLTVTGGTGSPSMTLSGSFAVPATTPTVPIVALSGTVIGPITAGASGTVSVGFPQFTTAAPLTLTLTAAGSSLPFVCTDTAPVTIASATITLPTALMANLQHGVIGVGVGTSLYDKVGQGQTYLEANDIVDTCSTMKAFNNQVIAQTGQHLAKATATQLIGSSNQIQNVLAC
jgi:hypothetical protein